MLISRPLPRTDFKAYRRGRLVEHTWASIPVAVAAETDAYQARVNRGDLHEVVVTPPGGPTTRITPR